MVKSVAIASGLGARSSHSWLKLPVIEQMAEVMTATTLPTLLLGGDPDGPQEQTYARWAAALALPGVRGFVVGGGIRSALIEYHRDVGVERTLNLHRELRR